MNEMTEREVEVRLATWLRTRAPISVPDDLATRVMAIPGATRTRPSPLRLFPVPGERARIMALRAAVIAVAVAGVALVAHPAGPNLAAPTALPSATTNVPSPTPAPASPTSSEPFRSGGLLPATIPASLPNGIVDTPIGRARWVHLQGDQTTLPDPLVPLRTPGGTLAWFDNGQPPDICYNGGEARPECTHPRGISLAFSSDLLGERSAQPLPVAAKTGDLLPVADTYWLRTTDPVTLWRSADLVTWQRTDTSLLLSPGPAGLSWTMSPDNIVAADGWTAALFTFTAADPGSLLGYPGRSVGLAKTASGYVAREFHSMRDGGDVDLGAISASVERGALVLRDATGHEVGRVEGAGLDFAEAWAQRRSIGDDVVAYLDGDRWTPAALAGADFGLGGEPSLIALDRTLFVFAARHDDLVESWSSADARAWTRNPLLADESGNELRSGGVWVREEPGVAPVLTATTMAGENGWTSTDGVTWTVDRAVPGNLAGLRLETGWVRTADQTGDGTWQVARDRSSWMQAPALSDVVTKIEPDGPGGSTESSIGNVLAFSVEELGGSRDVWLIEFEQAAR